MTRLSILPNPKPLLPTRTRKSIIRQTRRNNMKGGFPIPTLQQRQHLRDFEEATRPSVDEEQWDSSLDLVHLVHKVHVDVAEVVDGDGGLELRDGVVDAFFLGAPVEGG